MGDILIDIDISENTERVSRPSFAQLKAIVEFMDKHPNLANCKQKDGMTQERFKALWLELSNIVNGLRGTTKSMKGWIKFWFEKKQSITMKEKHISEGRSNDNLSYIDQRILDLISNNKHATNKRKNSIKQEICNSDDNELMENDDGLEFSNSTNHLMSAETDERHISVMEKLVNVMDQQASALSQMAEATLNNSKALEQIADASHKQAMAVDRLAGTFESINATVFDVRNSIMNIDYTMKRCYGATSSHHRQTTNIFT